MRNTSKKLALPVLAAASAALSAAGFTSMAKADFTFTYTQTVSGSNTVYVLYAKSDTLNSTGTTLANLDATITMTTGSMVINQTTDIDGDTVADADIFGCTVGNSTGVAFGNTLGTFIRTKAMTLALVMAQGQSEGAPVTEMQVGSPYPTFPQGYQTAPPGSTVQAVNARYSALKSLEIVGISGSSVANTGSGAAFCNLVVPTTASGKVIGQVAGSGGDVFTDTFVFGVTTSVVANPLVSLTSAAPTNMGSALGGLTVTAHYNPATAASSALSGNSKVSGFTPTTDTEIFLLKLSSSASDAMIIADINANALDAGLVASAPAGLLANLLGVAWDVEITASSPANPNGYFGFNLTDVSGLTVTEVAAVPEPASLGLLALSGIGLLARRRRA